MFLTEEHREIIEEDEVTILESDDLLQYDEFDCAYGGLNDLEQGEFSFRYFTDNENGSIWDIDLRKSDFEKIVKGEMKQLLLWAANILYVAVNIQMKMSPTPTVIGLKNRIHNKKD